jgi:hypothetical protein
MIAARRETLWVALSAGMQARDDGTNASGHK